MRATRRIVAGVLLVQIAWTVPAGLILGFIGGRAYALVFGAVALAILAVLLSFMLAWQRADARRAALLTHGTRLRARLVGSRPTSTRIRNRTLLVHTFEAHTAGRVVRARQKAFTHLPIGTEATIVYYTTDPARSAVVEDLDGTP